VLADDNFASIVAAVREGRTAHDNIRKVIAWTLPTSGGEALTIVFAILFGLTLPISPVQILWVNMVTAVALGLALAFEPTEPGTMRRPPRPAGEPLLVPVLIWRVVFVSALMVAGTFGAFAWADAAGLPLEVGRTMVVNALVVMEIFYLFSVRYVHRRLMLFAEMKLPGEAWLEFRITKNEAGGGGRWKLQQTATFRPRGLFGRLYWYAILPIHHFVFGGMARAIVERARDEG
jgi:magnesium-transporting ATPase (P-type)